MKKLIKIFSIILIFIFSLTIKKECKAFNYENIQNSVKRLGLNLIGDNKNNDDIKTKDTKVDDILNNMTLEEKIGQLFIVDITALSNGYYKQGNINLNIENSIKKYNVGGVIFFEEDIKTRSQTKNFIKDLQKASKTQMFIAVDEEGGRVARIANNKNMKTTKFPYMSEVGANKKEEYAYDMGATIGSEIKTLGFNLDFAPVADVLTNKSSNGIGNRSFGSDEKLVAKMVKNVVNGLQDANVSATLKHFPGHGDADSDSHDGAVIVENDIKRLRKVEFLPFKAGIKQGVDFIMISHISISRVTEDTVPASMSKIVLKDIIRKELEFEGVVITDAFNMKAITDNYTTKEAVVESIKNGTDIILMPQNLKQAYNAVLEALEDDIITEKRINESVLRILRTKVKRGIILPDTNLSKK